jgi:hypothetical protein
MEIVLPSVKNIQDIVTHDDETDFDGYTMAELWGNVVSYIPEMRGRSLAEDLTEVFQSCFTSSAVERVMAGYDLAAVRMGFISMMHIHKVGHTHVIKYMSTDTAYWLERFNDKLEALIPGEIFRRRLIQAPGFPEKIEHGWVH